MAVILGGCHKKDDEPVLPEVPLTLSTEEFVFDAFGGWQEFVIHCSGAWTISDGTAWCQPGATSGSEEATVRVMVEAFMQAADRSVDLTVRCGSQTKVLTVTQKGISPLTQVTDKFDQDFARVLQTKGYIKNSANITWGEVSNITELYVSEANLTSMQGIEYFSALTRLHCDLNYLKTLDVSHNLELTILNCFGNHITSLDVSKNVKLQRFWCYENRLTSLDVSRNTALTYLSCSRNRLTALDISTNTALVDLFCEDNLLTSLNIGANAKLAKLTCYNNQLTALDLSRCPELYELSCSNNQLASLDISKNTNLEILHCYSNPGTGTDFPLTAWFDDNNIPASLQINAMEWTHGNNRVTVRVQKSGTGN